MELVYEKSEKPVEIGDVHTLSDDYKVNITGIQEPHKPGSTGRVFCSVLSKEVNNKEYGIGTMAYFPGVIGAKWINREDQ